jgi:hypothetical protein
VGARYEEDMCSLLHNQIWDLVQFPGGKRELNNKWVHMLKEKDGGKKRYKDRFVVKGFAHKKCIDFDEICSLVVKINSTKTILNLVAIECFHLKS